MLRSLPEGYVDRGFVVVPGFVGSETIEALALECSRLLQLDPSEGSLGARSNVFETVGPPRLEGRPAARSEPAAFDAIRTAWPLTKEVRDVLFGERMRALVQGCLGTSTPVLFNEQYIVKRSRSGSAGAFGWHRDSDSLLRATGENGTPYVSVWVAIDDMTRSNGCLVVRPSNAPEDEVQLEVAAGTAIVMSSMVEHRSGPNATRFSRRAWMPQFSRRPIVAHGGGPVSLSVPFPEP